MVTKFVKFKLQMFAEFQEDLSSSFTGLLARLLKSGLISLETVWHNYFKLESVQSEKNLKDTFEARTQAAAFIFKRANFVRVTGNDKEEERQEQKMRDLLQSRDRE